MFNTRGSCGILMMLVGVLGLVGTALGAPVAMVSDLSGSVTTERGEVEILTEFEVGAKVTVAEGATLSVVYYADGTEYNFSGPAGFEVGDDAPRSVYGSEPVLESLSPEGSGSVSIVGLAQAAMVMRANPDEARLTLVFPVETTLLVAPSAFEWQALDTGVGYTFELTDSEGRSLLETTVTGTSLKLPHQVELKPGEDYTWSLETRLPDGAKFSSWASFRVADDHLRAKVAERRPDDEKDVSRLVVFALWLEHNDLFDEARKYWAKIDQMRPGGANIEARLGG